MAKELKSIPFEEFSNNLADILRRVVREDESVVVETEEGERAILKPARPRKAPGRKKTKADYEAFRSAAGGWKDFDADKFIEDIYESRRHPTRPPVEL